MTPAFAKATSDGAPSWYVREHTGFPMRNERKPQTSTGENEALYAPGCDPSPQRESHGVSRAQPLEGGRDKCDTIAQHPSALDDVDLRHDLERSMTIDSMLDMLGGEVR